MNPAFQEALAARCLWLNVVVLQSIEGSERHLEEARQAAYDAVHSLASNDVLKYQHYGPRAPLLLSDVPELADQYNLAHELYTELYHLNFHNGSLETLEPDWLPPAAPLSLPYTQWSAAVDDKIGGELGVKGSEALAVTSAHAYIMLNAWRQGMSVDDAAAAALAPYNAGNEGRTQQAWQQQLNDPHARSMAIDADLVAGWCSECEDLDLLE